MKGLLYLLINVVLAATEMQVMKMFRKVPGQEARGKVLSKGEVLSRLECSFTCSSVAKGCVAYNIFKGEPLICQTLKKVTKVRSNSKVDVYTAGCVDSGDRCDSLGGDCAESCLTTEYINGTCLGVNCMCCIEKNCYHTNSSCGTSRTCRESCLIDENVSGTCGGRDCKCCEKKCHNLNSSCGTEGTCRESCLNTEDFARWCNGYDCKCCEKKAWPAGYYGLPKPNTGCPGTRGSVSWSTGYRYHDLTMHSSWPSDTKLTGSKNDAYYYQHFCMKSNSNGRGSWPIGKYCIFRHGSSGCPSGFSQGRVYWNEDDETSGNSHSGSLPYGIYRSSYTHIYYCCRSDGNYATEIYLPTDKPFFLFRYGGICQTVHGMSYSADYFRWGLESIGSSTIFSGSTPDSDTDEYDDHSHLTLQYCYYYT